jgi:hypothetical protein
MLLREVLTAPFDIVENLGNDISENPFLLLDRCPFLMKL